MTLEMQEVEMRYSILHQEESTMSVFGNFGKRDLRQAATVLVIWLKTSMCVECSKGELA